MQIERRLAESEVQTQIHENQIAVLQKRLERRSFGAQILYYWASADEFIQALRFVEEHDEFIGMAASLAKTSPDVIDDTVGRLLDLLDVLDEETRIRVFDTLSLIHQQSAERLEPHADAIVTKLAPLLDDASSTVVGYSISMLGALGPPARPTLDSLKEIMLDDANWYAPNAALAVAAIDPSLDIGHRLIELIEAKHPNWYQAAIYLTEHVPPERARQVLTTFYKSTESQSDRDAVIQVLNQIKP